MLRIMELFIICVILVGSGTSAPWSENNDLREYDLEWQCEQLCDRLYGTSTYNENNSTCSCSIDKDDPEINWKRIKNNARNLGLILEIINSNAKNVIKRETPAERLKKLIESKKTINNDLEEERIRKIKELLQNTRSKITTNLEDKPEQNDEPIKTPVKINLPVIGGKIKKTDPEPIQIEPTKPEKLSITDRLKQKKESIVDQPKMSDEPPTKPEKISITDRLKQKKESIVDQPKMSDEPAPSRHEIFLEKRRKLREQLKERLLAARMRNKTPDAA